MKRVSFSIIAVTAVSTAMLILAASNITAQDREYGDQRPQQQTESKRFGVSANASSRGSARATSHVGGSPFPTPTPTDSQFVADTGQSGLDTECQFRSKGSLRFTVTIDRYVGPTNGDGKLSNPQALVNNGVITPTVTLTMPAFDVDYSTVTFPPDQPERDRILFNGEFIGNLGSEGYLDGENNKWRMNTINVPVNLVKFARLNGSGPPTASENEIEILIDQGNIATNQELWCTSIDWAAIKVKALYPVVMLHGNGESGPFWDRLNFTTPFIQAGIPYDNTISNPTAFIAVNAGLLANKIPVVAIRFGVRHLHLVAHSKGGLDSRAFLKSLPPDLLGILSVTTLSTPHHGSVLADYVRDSIGANAFLSDDSVRVGAMQWKARDYDDGRKNLTTSFVRDFNATNLPLPKSFTVAGEETPVKYFSWGADANLDGSMSIFGNPTITIDELQGTDHAGGGYLTEKGATSVYRIVYYVASTHWEWRTTVLGNRVRVVRETQNATVQPNDMLVSLSSSKIAPYIPMTDQLRNHATITDQGMGELVLQLIKTIQPLQ